MAVRGGNRAAATGIQLEDLPQGETTYKITKQHEPEPRNDLPTADDADAFQWQIQRKDNGICEYVNLHDGKPALHELAAMYGPGLYVLTPLDPQTRKEIKSLTEHAKIAAPAMTHNPMQQQPHHQPAPAFDLSWELAQRQMADAKEERLRIESERMRMDADARQRADEFARQQAEDRRLDRERRDDFTKQLFTLAGSVVAGLPTAFAAIKTSLAPPPPPPSTDSKVVDTLVDELREARRRLDGKSDDNGGFDRMIDNLSKVLVVKQLTREMRDDDGGDGLMDQIKEGFGLAKEGLPMLQGLMGRPAEQQPGQPYNPFASPDALLQAAMADPALAERTLAQLGKTHPEAGAKLAAMLQGAAEDEAEDAKPRKLLRAAK